MPLSRVWQVCKIAARDLHESIVNSAFELTERLLRDHFALITGEAMPELVDALVSIAQSPFTDMALQALSHLARCAQVWYSAGCVSLFLSLSH